MSLPSSAHRHAVVVGVLGSIGQLLANQLSVAGYSVTGIDLAADGQSLEAPDTHGYPGRYPAPQQ